MKLHTLEELCWRIEDRHLYSKSNQEFRDSLPAIVADIQSEERDKMREGGVSQGCHGPNASERIRNCSGARFAFRANLMFWSKDILSGEISLIETRPCSECKCHKRLVDGSICTKHLMAIHPEMLVTYMERNGTCFEQRDKENATLSNG